MFTYNSEQYFFVTAQTHSVTIPGPMALPVEGDFIHGPLVPNITMWTGWF